MIVTSAPSPYRAAGPPHGRVSFPTRLSQPFGAGFGADRGFMVAGSRLTARRTVTGSRFRATAWRFSLAAWHFTLCGLALFAACRFTGAVSKPLL
ncbi:hypothetical protein [Couchioplanes caeruleus]|nr:hypothetical protein [Couchioplanes caeruleus]